MTIAATVMCGAICYGLRGALQGLVEQGCNGPCKDALDKLDKHLNKSAHPHIKED